jgi:hypothetical protein
LLQCKFLPYNDIDDINFEKGIIMVTALAQWLERVVGRQDIIAALIGLASAVVNNVPLVAASMGLPACLHWAYLNQ